MTDHPAALRNVEPILGRLQQLITGTEKVLEIASGQGTHGERAARRWPQIQWQMTELSQEQVSQLKQRRANAGLANLLPPLQLDVLNYDWAQQRVDLLLAINLVHISPMAVLEQLCTAASQCLRPKGKLVLYGPYKIDHQHTSTGNAEFDAQLRQRNPLWGVRDLSEAKAAAASHGLELTQQIAMPANNQLLVLQRRVQPKP